MTGPLNLFLCCFFVNFDFRETISESNLYQPCPPLLLYVLQDLPGAGEQPLQPDGEGDALPPNHLSPRGGPPPQGVAHCRPTHPRHGSARQVCAIHGETL